MLAARQTEVLEEVEEEVVVEVMQAEEHQELSASITPPVTISTPTTAPPITASTPTTVPPITTYPLSHFHLHLQEKLDFRAYYIKVAIKRNFILLKKQLQI